MPSLMKQHKYGICGFLSISASIERPQAKSVSALGGLPWTGGLFLYL